ncbi:MAG: ferritin-like domain-containing protein [Acidobacteriota bacterium]
MKIQSLYDFYLIELHNLYDAERQIVKALPKMIDASTSAELKGAFRTHLDQTQLHVNRLEEVFEMHAETPKAEKCYGMEGILKEGQDLLKANIDPNVRDAALISAAQRVEHYEIATYGCVCTWADLLGFDRAAQVLRSTLEEEVAADGLLNSIAKSKVNAEAAHRAG